MRKIRKWPPMKAYLEPLLHPCDNSLIAKRVRLSSFDHPYHFHPEIEITFIAKSSGTRVIGDHIGSFQAGELYILGANVPHVFRNTLCPAGGAEAEVLQFQGERMHGFPEARGFNRLLDRSDSGMVFDCATSERGARLMRQIRQTKGVLRLPGIGFALHGSRDQTEHNEIFPVNRTELSPDHSMR